MNKIILLGRLTKNPETKYTQTNNTMVVNFSLAVNRRFAKPGEEQQADFINMIAFGKTAEFINNYFSKGQQVAIAGKLQTRSWDDEQGQKHYATEVIAEEAYFADSKKTQTVDASILNGSLTPQIPTLSEEFSSSDDDLPF